MARQFGYRGRSPLQTEVSKSGLFDLIEQYIQDLAGNWPGPSYDVTIKYVLKNVTTTSQKSYDSGDIVLNGEPGMYFLGIHNDGFTSRFGSAGNGPRPAGNGKPPSAAVYVCYRKPVTVSVTAVNGSGAVTAFSLLSKGKGTSRSPGTSVSFTGGNGSGAQFLIEKDTDNLVTATNIGSSGGTGYQVGDTLSFTDDLPTALSGFDTDWDIFLHGVGGNGGQNGGSAVIVGTGGAGSSGFYFTPSAQVVRPAGGAAGTSSGSYVAQSGGNGGSGGPFPGSGGGGGGGGWGGGGGGQAAGGDGGSTSYGGGGGAGYSYLNTAIVTNGTALTTTFASPGIDLYVNGVNVANIENETTSYLLSS